MNVTLKKFEQGQKVHMDAEFYQVPSKKNRWYLDMHVGAKEFCFEIRKGGLEVRTFKGKKYVQIRYGVMWKKRKGILMPDHKEPTRSAFILLKEFEQGMPEDIKDYFKKTKREMRKNAKGSKRQKP